MVGSGGLTPCHMAHADNLCPVGENPPSAERQKLQECKCSWERFFDQYKELQATPDFLNEWVALQYRAEKTALWNDMAAKCGFDKPRASDGVHIKSNVWKYQDVKRSRTDGALLSAPDVRDIPGFNHEGEEWQHHRHIESEWHPGIITLRSCVSTGASRGASRRCKIKWGPHGL